LFWRQHKTQNTTHTDTTAKKMSRATLPSSGFAPSLFGLCPSFCPSVRVKRKIPQTHRLSFL
jgi:hypothetical protein